MTEDIGDSNPSDPNRNLPSSCFYFITLLSESIMHKLHGKHVGNMLNQYLARLFNVVVGCTDLHDRKGAMFVYFLSRQY